MEDSSISRYPTTSDNCGGIRTLNCAVMMRVCSWSNKLIGDGGPGGSEGGTGGWLKRRCIWRETGSGARWSAMACRRRPERSGGGETGGGDGGGSRSITSRLAVTLRCTVTNWPPPLPAASVMFETSTESWVALSPSASRSTASTAAARSSELGTGPAASENEKLELTTQARRALWLTSVRFDVLRLLAVSCAVNASAAASTSASTARGCVATGVSRSCGSMRGGGGAKGGG